MERFGVYKVFVAVLCDLIPIPFKAFFMFEDF